MLRKSGPPPKGLITGKSAAKTATKDAKAVVSIEFKKIIFIYIT
jgi:hypothetical protein